MRFDAEFSRSALSMAECPEWDRIEIALAGRSNVGKSSLLNSLARHRNLARVSKTPGRTRCVNFFTVGDRLALVDLPGYGYAKMGHDQSEAVTLLMNQYLGERRELAGLVLLIDSRRGPEREELLIAHRLQEPPLGAGLPKPHLLVVATKCDKLNQAERATALERFKVIAASPSFCSSLTGEGIDQLRREILRLA